jgi:hypothetical protein
MPMRDLWKWWRLRPGQLSAVLILGALLAWMSVGLWQAERHYREVVRELRESFRQQERVRQMQFAQLLSTLDGPLARQDRELAARREDERRLVEMLSRLLEQHPSAAR